MSSEEKQRKDRAHMLMGYGAGVGMVAMAGFIMIGFAFYFHFSKEYAVPEEIAMGKLIEDEAAAFFAQTRP